MQTMETNNPKPFFIIRKIPRKVSIQGKNQTETYDPHSETNSQKGSQYPNCSISRPEKQNEAMENQFANKVVASPKAELNTLKEHLDSNKKGVEIKLLELKLSRQEQEKNKLKAQKQKQKIKKQKPKYLQSLILMKEKLQVLGFSLHLNSKVPAQVKHHQNPIIQNKFQDEYDHDIDPDRMTYEELLQLGERIGVVCKGLPKQLIQTLPKVQIQVSSLQKCPVCYSNYEQGQTKTQISNCRHEFHFECLQSWLAIEKVCPICKQQIEFKEPGSENASVQK